MMRVLAGLLALSVAAPALAQMPEDACYAMRLTPHDLAQQPERGVQALYVHFVALRDFEESSKGPWRHLRISAVMADQGQGARDGAVGATLTQVAECRTGDMLCWAYDNTSFLTVQVRSAQVLELRTDDFVVADFGESMMASNLAETIGQESVYTLFRLNDGPCPVE
jgi:hypothetical protein